MTTKRAGPERAFEREALTFPTRDSAFLPIASAHSRTQGRNAQNIQDAPIATTAPERAKLWRESASATKFRLARRWCSHLLPAVEGWRTGCPAQAGVFSSRCDRPTGGELPADQRRAVPSSPGRPT